MKGALWVEEPDLPFSSPVGVQSADSLRDLFITQDESHGDATLIAPLTAVEQKRERDRKRYEANKERIKEARRAYYEANKERIKESNRKRYTDNKERYIGKLHEYREANPEKIRDVRRKRYELNLELKEKKSREYYEASEDREQGYGCKYYLKSADKSKEKIKKTLDTLAEKVQSLPQPEIYQPPSNICSHCHVPIPGIGSAAMVMCAFCRSRF